MRGVRAGNVVDQSCHLGRKADGLLGVYARAWGANKMILAALILTAPATWHPVTFSVYATRYHGRTAADGSRYHHERLTCASNNHPKGTMLECRYKGRVVRVRVTDRMAKGLGKTRIDLSGAAFRALHPRYDMTDATGTLLRGEWREVKQ